MSIPLVKHKVVKGDNLTKIVKKYGFAAGAWKQIYKAPYNKDFRKKRTDPNLILPGDEFFVPGHSKATVLLHVMSTGMSIAAVMAALSMQKKLLARVKASIKSINKKQDAAYSTYKAEMEMLRRGMREVEKTHSACNATMADKTFADIRKKCSKPYLDGLSAFENLWGEQRKIRDAAQLELKKQGKLMLNVQVQLQKTIKSTEAYLTELEKSQTALGKIGSETF